jgi:hypothetical protein
MQVSDTRQFGSRSGSPKPPTDRATPTNSTSQLAGLLELTSLWAHGFADGGFGADVVAVAVAQLHGGMLWSADVMVCDDGA